MQLCTYATVNVPCSKVVVFISLYGCYRVLGESTFFLSINVSKAGVLYTMVSCNMLSGLTDSLIHTLLTFVLCNM